MLSRRQIIKSSVAAGLSSSVLSTSWAAEKKAVVITGSPRRRGTSFVLADNFIRGLKEQGADVYRFDAAFERVTACSGCDHCGLGASDCVYRDDMFKLNPYLIESQLVVFCTPLYYFGFSSQLKLVIDRFYAINSQLHAPKRAVLLATAWNTNDWTMTALVEHYRTIVRYMGWEDQGMVLAIGCGYRSAIERSDFPKQAYELGKSVRIL